MDYMQKPVMMPSMMQAPVQGPIQAPIQAPVTAPAAYMPMPVYPAYESVSVQYVHKPDCCEPKRPYFTSTGVILVLFILLVIISRGKF